MLEQAFAFHRTARTGSTLEFLRVLEGRTKSTTPRRSGLSGNWLLGGALSIAILAGLIHWWSPTTPTDIAVAERAVEEPDADSPPTDLTLPVSPPGQAPGPDLPADAPPVPSLPPDAAALAKIERILEMAELHQLLGRLVEPAGSNDAEAYHAVLEMHPGNARALQGLAHICDILLESARAKFDLKDYPGALEEVDAGLQLIPRHGVAKSSERQQRSAVDGGRPHGIDPVAAYLSYWDHGT